MDAFLRKYNLLQDDLAKMGYNKVLDWKELDDLMEDRLKKSANYGEPSLSYNIIRKNVVGFPTELEIIFRCKSIIGVEDTEKPRKPIFGYLHKMRILLPYNYLSADGRPIFTFRTNVWHPNIRYSGTFKGHVCLAKKEIGVLISLKDMVLRVERLLKYYNLNLLYPEDKEVAKWVMDEAMPNGWIHQPCSGVWILQK